MEGAGFRLEGLAYSSQNASQIWSTSRQIQQHGKMNLSSVSTGLRLEGKLFGLMEGLYQMLCRTIVSEEITIVARRA